MSNDRIIDTGVIEGSMLEHFNKAAAGIGARLAGLSLMEPGPRKWGTSPAEFQRNVAEQVAEFAEGIEGEQFGPDGKMVPAKLGGFPNVIAAARAGTLRLLVGIDRSGCRQVACAIVEGAHATAAPRQAVPRQAAPAPASWKGTLPAAAFMAAGFLAAWWIWTRPAGSMSDGAKYGLLFLVILVFSALATWASGSGSRR